jgi:hypothetical protein
MTIIDIDVLRSSLGRRLLIVIFVVGLVIGIGSTYLVPRIVNSTSSTYLGSMAISGPAGTIVAVPGAQVLASGTGQGTQEILLHHRSALRFHRLGLDATCVGQNDNLVVKVYIPGLSLPLGFIPICRPSGGGMFEVALPKGTLGYPDKVVVHANSSTRWSFMLVNSENSLGMVLVRSLSCVL